MEWRERVKHKYAWTTSSWLVGFVYHSPEFEFTLSATIWLWDATILRSVSAKTVSLLLHHWVYHHVVTCCSLWVCVKVKWLWLLLLLHKLLLLRVQVHHTSPSHHHVCSELLLHHRLWLKTTHHRLLLHHHIRIHHHHVLTAKLMLL